MHLTYSISLWNYTHYANQPCLERVSPVSGRKVTASSCGEAAGTSKTCMTKWDARA